MRRLGVFVAVAALGCAGGRGGTSSKPSTNRPQAQSARGARRQKHQEELAAFARQREAEARHAHRTISTQQIAREWAVQQAERTLRRVGSTTITIGNAP